MTRREIGTDEVVAHLEKQDLPKEGIAKFQAALEGKPLPRRRSHERYQLADFRLSEIKRLNASGMRDHEIASKLGVSRAYVCQRRNEHGIPPPR